MGRQTFVLSNGLVLGAQDSQSLGPGSMLGMQVCLFILPSSPELSEILFLACWLFLAKEACSLLQCFSMLSFYMYVPYCLAVHTY